jgi:hypothetical protein
MYDSIGRFWYRLPLQIIRIISIIALSRRYVTESLEAGLARAWSMQCVKRMLHGMTDDHDIMAGRDAKSKPIYNIITMWVKDTLSYTSTSENT